MRRLRYSFAIVMGMVLVSGCLQARSEQPQPAVATVDGQTIRAEQFRQRYLNYLLRTGLEDGPALRQSILEAMVEDKLLVQDAYAQGIATEALYEEQTARIRRKLLIEAYAGAAIYDTLTVTEAEVREMFVRANTTMEARHLYARTKEQAEALYARLRAGESFEALAREVFANPELAENGGSVGSFGFDEMDVAFEDAAFTLPVGEISEPVRTAQGYSIIQVTDRFTKPIILEDDFAKRKANMEGFVRSRKQQQARTRFADQLAQDIAVQFQEKGLDHLTGQVTGQALIENDEEGWQRLAEPLVSFRQRGNVVTWTLADFREAARYTSEDMRAQVRSKSDLERFIQGLIVREEMVRRAQAERLDETRMFALALEEATEKWVLDEHKTRLRRDVVVPDDSTRAYFERYAHEYVVPQKVEVSEIAVETKAEATRLQAQLATTPFTELARQHSIRPGADATGGSLGYVTQQQLGVLGGVVFDAQVGEVLGPLEVAGRYVLLRIGDRQASRPATYEEVAGEVRTYLHERYADQALHEHVVLLREEATVAIDGHTVVALDLKQPITP